MNWLNFLLKVLMIFFLVALPLASCGKKGPPVPPKMPALKEVTDQEARRLDNRGEDLTRTLPVCQEAPTAEGFKIYPSKKTPEDFGKCRNVQNE